MEGAEGPHESGGGNTPQHHGVAEYVDVVVEGDERVVRGSPVECQNRETQHDRDEGDEGARRVAVRAGADWSRFDWSRQSNEITTRRL